MAPDTTSTEIAAHEATIDKMRRDLHAARPANRDIEELLDDARRLLTEASRDLELAKQATAAEERLLDAPRPEDATPDDAAAYAGPGTTVDQRRRAGLGRIMSADAHPELLDAALLLDRQLLGALSTLTADNDDAVGAPRYPGWCIALAEANRRWPFEVEAWITAGAPDHASVEDLRQRLGDAYPFGRF